MPNALFKSTVFTVLSVASAAQGGDFQLHPSLAVSEEFTDNVFETRTNRTSDYITRALPGLIMNYKAPALEGDLNYVFDYRHYARDSRGDEVSHTLNAKAKLTAVDNLLFLEAADDYQRVSLDVTRDTTRESLFVNQSDRNIITASPYFTLRPSARFPVKGGYRYTDTRYINSPGIDKTDHMAFLDVAYELSKSFSLTAGYTFTRELADIDDFSQHQALGGFRYEYAEKSFLFAQAGNTWTRYSSGQRLDSLAWNAGLTHVFDTLTATLTTGVSYNEDPLSNVIKESFVRAIIEQRLKRGSISFSPVYSDYATTKTDTLQTRKYGATVTGQYDFSADLKGRLAFTAEKYEQQLLDSYTRRFQVDSGISYLLAERLTVALSYVYAGYYSPGIITDNWHVNRAMVELKKTF
ncbi:MAG: TIGR03016 family PEP-CTERM system-associated outer membrane protein [Desulfuromonadaceae bacterium]|nr:TIGR03016 family PEP-CTERM system-associated outer membrane protein [Desulfuromonadaceae bacterium]MDD2848929.1 TIGR03016 family PEP-CTERM system-associated outer membrane protein [Desulfuromonadaceae bacterium]MDD4131703.1 TIGR03016 family PEP-CTERM system-associated outer membrane protein [Desulfuromonadaceae bacterium]